MNHKQEEMPLFFKEMLQELIKRRNKLIQMEKATKIWTYFCLGCIAALVLLAFYAFSFGAFKSGFNYHKLFQIDPMTIFLVLLVAIGIAQVRYFQKKEKKAEKEYEELRAEVIEKTPELWEADGTWVKRHKLFKQIGKQHDINLFYK
ncbi:DUF2663 family protein [Alkalihalobacillus pseudalcaliphilus]|uniref:DUF2663 family protein n=1 Tax=Alkalihalobacillus pseudalcaliphilus TaxID=79884 RepID=UPI00064D8517|nr:DUF2663 family protein [Alkalihalobacillus pseudalcaliphilus]KMK76475.1 hypothetical protein AB990_14930 [Alkalihalobacillus pseudalcaliphilus]